MRLEHHYYLFNSRVATHLLFWIAYFMLFGFIWAEDKGYLASYYLEFVLLPTRLLSVYVTLYFLLPKFLLNRKYGSFILGYGITLLSAGLLQRIFTHLFYENLLLNDTAKGLFSINMLIRAMVLINTTVLFVLGIKLFQLWLLEREKNLVSGNEILEIKSNRRIHRVEISNILLVEGLGNYVVYHLSDNSRLTAYGTIKDTLTILPENFVRVHKSFIVNKQHIKSYDNNTVDVRDHRIPRGKSVTDELLLN
ncbi:MAG TPA: LytTR family DNA-binding domain-containing protein [Eudoraea sp.]|nr:LytTR family DNA-binding domain-containing protein [Eudoraea sp.]